jgi:hypothetical protein
MNFGDFLRGDEMKRAEIFRTIQSNFFLRKHKLLPSTLRLLEDIYPAVDWSRVDFYEGLPWYTPSIAPFVTAQALPDFYSFGRFRIYLRKFDESRAQCLADIVHEAMHVRQGMRFARGFGLGMLRGFTVYYIALYMQHGYRQSPLEIPAYDQEFRFLAFCEKHHQHGIHPAVDPAIFKNIAQETSLVFGKIDFKYKAGLPRLAASAIACVFIALLKPVVDVFAFLIFLPAYFKSKKRVEIFSRGDAV